MTNSGNTGGAGGVGLYTTIIDAMGAATSTGQLSSGHYYFAGGGGGGTDSSGGSLNNGGLGGGGSGSGAYGTYCNGTPNTGGGGGGIGQDGSNHAGGNGGSGLVIIRYPNTKTITVGAGLTATTVTSGSYKYTKFTAGTDTVTF